MEDGADDEDENDELFASKLRGLKRLLDQVKTRMFEVSLLLIVLVHEDVPSVSPFKIANHDESEIASFLMFVHRHTKREEPSDASMHASLLNLTCTAAANSYELEFDSCRDTESISSHDNPDGVHSTQSRSY